MRASTLGEQTVLGAAFRKTYFRVTIADATGTPQDLTSFDGYDWVSSVTIDENLDQPVAGCTINLRRQVDIVGGIGVITLSPLRSDSSANVSGPAIDTNRPVQVYMAVVAGARPINASTDWKLKFNGYSDDIEFATANVIVTCRDDGGELVDQLVDPDFFSNGPNAIDRPDLPLTLEATIDRLLNFGVIGGVTPTVFVPTDPAYMVASFPVSSEPIMTAVQRAAGLAALDFRYSWDDGTSAYRPTLNIPVRTGATSSWTYPKSAVVGFRSLSQSRLGVRNRVIVNYRPQNAKDGRRAKVEVDDATSQTKYGLRPLIITEADDSDINTNAKATFMATSILADLKDQKAEAEVEILPDWRIELFDYATFAANQYFDTDQSWALVAIRHELSVDKQRTILTVRGTPSAAYERWLLRARSLGPEHVLTDADNGISDINYTEDPVFLTRTWTWTRGANVAFIWFYETLLATPVATSSYPKASAVPTLVGALILPTSTNSYTAQIPTRGKQRFAIAVPYYKSGGTYVQGTAVKFTLDPLPNAVSTALKGAVTNGTVDLSATIAGGFSDFPLGVDFFADDITGAAIASTTINGNTTLDKTSTGCAGLGALVLPLRELRRFFAKVTNVAGEVRWAEVGIDRNAVSDGAGLTITDYNVEPVLLVNFDGTVDEVVFTAPSGKTLTFTGLAGSAGSRQYVVAATALDDGSHESVMAPEESRNPYTIQVTAGGVTRTVWSGPLHGVIAAAVPNGTVAIDSNGAYQWTVDGPTVQDSITYAESTSAYPSDATALAGTSISGRVCTRTGGGPLTFGQTVFVSIASYDSHGNVIQIMHLRGAFQSFSGSKTTSYGPSQWHLTPLGLGGGEVDTFTWDGNGWPQCDALPSSDFSAFQMFPVLPDGVTISSIVGEVLDNATSGNTNPITFNATRQSGGGATSLGSASSTRGGGNQNLTISVSESTTSRVYVVGANLGGAIINNTTVAGTLRIGPVHITYTQPDPKKGV